MRSIDLFTLADSHRKKDKKMLVSKQGTPLSVDVDGLMIEAQFELEDGRFLVWLTEDCPYDEMLYIYLIDPGGAILDSVEAGAILGLGPAGILHILETGENWVEFDFFSKKLVCRLEVSSESKMFRRLPEYWRYKKRLKRHHIVIQETQQEDV